MNNSVLFAIADHLWQSTLFAVAVGVVTLMLRNNSARIRYSLWLVASLKFLLPFSLLTALGAELSHFTKVTQQTQDSVITVAAQNVAQITAIGGGRSIAMEQVQDHAGSFNISALLIAVEILWAIGALAVATRWFSRWMQIRRVLRQSTASELPFVIPVRLSASQLEPGIVGIVHPVLLLPAGIDKTLSIEQMSAVLAHERCHLAWRDNLAGALHMLVEALFWFHPLIWWIGKQLIDERERACDEYVIASGYARESYAEGILNVCEQYLKLQLPCVSGVSGAKLKQRMEDIMKMRLIERLSGARKILLSIAAAVTIAAPVAVGVLTAPSVNAQTAQGGEQPVYKNVSIRLASVGRGGRMLVSPIGLQVENMSLRNVIASAYGVNAQQVVGRDWTKEPSYNITAIADTAIADGPAPSQTTGGAELAPLNTRNGTALQELLSTHFGLVVRVEKKSLDGYALLLGTGESKLTVSTADPKQRSLLRSPTGLKAINIPLSDVTQLISRNLGVPVTDQTALQGNFDFEITWEPSSSGAPDQAAVANMLVQQLGLKLEAKPTTADIVNVVNLKSPDEVVNTVSVSTLPAPLAAKMPPLPQLNVQVPDDLDSQAPLTHAQIVGVYDGGGNTDVNIIDVGGKLYRRLPQAADSLLMPAGVNSYRPEGKDSVVVTFFEKDGSVHLLLNLSGAKFVLDKKPS